MIKAVIFDMDGVIVDSEPLWEEAAFTYLARQNITAVQDEATQRYINNEVRGRKWSEVVSKLKQYFHLPASERIISKQCLKILFSIFDKRLQAIPGAVTLIQTLHANNYPLALASSAPKKVVTYITQKLDISNFFTAIITGNEVRRGKPNPEIFLTTAEKLQQPPSYIMVIEDSISGIRAAKNAQMKCVAVKHPYTDNTALQLADLAVTNLNQLTLDAIKKL